MVPRLESPRFFDAHLEKALAQARRYGRRVALLVVRAAPDAGEASLALRRAARPLLDALRTSDVATLQGEELRVLLPETDRLGALLLHQRMLRLVPEASDLRLGSAAFPEDASEGAALLRLAGARADAAAEALGPAHELRPLGFWESARRLLAGSAYARAPLSPAMMRAAKREAILDLARASTLRGIVALDGGDDKASEELWGDLPPQRLAGRIFVAQPRARALPPHPSLSHVPEEEARHGFLLALSGHASLAILRAPEGEGLLSTDLALVSHLVAGFREAYGLREAIG